MSLDSAAILEAAVEAAREAGALIAEDFKKPKKISHKGRIDLVTETDLKVEKFLRGRLSAILPEAGFLGEETASDAALGELSWVIDPVDGTTNFAHGFPFVACSIGLWVKERVELGVVNVPLMGELFSAARGRGAYLNGEPIQVTDEDKLENALVATGFPYDILDKAETVTANLVTMLKHSQGVRRPGAAAIDLAYLSCGRVDLFYEPSLKPWDTAAGWVLVEEAGGRVSSYDPVRPYRLGAATILASNGRLHDQAAELIKA